MCKDYSTIQVTSWDGSTASFADWTGEDGGKVWCENHLEQWANKDDVIQFRSIDKDPNASQLFYVGQVMTPDMQETDAVVFIAMKKGIPHA